MRIILSSIIDLDYTVPDKFPSVYDSDVVVKNYHIRNWFSTKFLLECGQVDLYLTCMNIMKCQSWLVAKVSEWNDETNEVVYTLMLAKYEISNNTEN